MVEEAVIETAVVVAVTAVVALPAVCTAVLMASATALLIVSQNGTIDASLPASAAR